MAHRDGASRFFSMEPLDGPLTLTAAASSDLFLRQQQHFSSTDAADADRFTLHDGRAESATNELMPLPVLSVEERELLLLALQDAPIEIDDNSDAIDLDSGDGDGNDDGKATGGSTQDELEGSGESSGSTGANGQVNRQKAKVGADTTEQAHKEAEDAEDTQDAESQNEQQRPIVKVNPRRNRKRRKHEVDALRVEEKELLEKLKELQEKIQQQQKGVGLRAQGSGGTLVATSIGDSQSQSGQWIVIKKEKSPSLSSASIWESLAWFQREETRSVMKENMRLRSVYQNQLHTLRHLESTYNSQLMFPFHAELDTGVALTKRPRVDPFDEDFAIFASLGHDFDAQYLKADSILESAGLANFDGCWRQEMIPKRGANGIYFLESVFSKMIPREMHAHDQRLWEILSNEELHAHHSVYEVRERTNDTMFRKIVNTIRLPSAEATLIRRTALKRYIQEHRVVVVWDTVLEISGSISMRLRERGWKILRKPHITPPNHSGGSLSMEQACARITPELSSIYSEEDIAVGSLTNAIVDSYRRHLKRMHHLNKDMFVAKFEKMSIHEKCHPHRRHKKHHHHHHHHHPPSTNGSAIFPPAHPFQEKTEFAGKEHCPVFTPVHGGHQHQGVDCHLKLDKRARGQLRDCLVLL